MRTSSPTIRYVSKFCFLNLQTMASNWKVFAVQRIDPKVCLFVIKHKGGDQVPGEQPLPAPDTSPKVIC